MNAVLVCVLDCETCELKTESNCDSSNYHKLTDMSDVHIPDTHTHTYGREHVNAHNSM